MTILVLHGPNLNLLGRRPRDHYGEVTLAEIDAAVTATGRSLGVRVTSFQSNDEGALVTRIQEASDLDGIVINPGGFTHTSVAIRDAIEASPVPAIEVHVSNIHGREPFRHRSVIAPACWGQIAGLGVTGYQAALYSFSLRKGSAAHV